MSYTIRKLQIKDFLRFHKFYDSLSENTKQLMGLYWIGWKQFSFKWLIVQIVNFGSTVKFIKRFFYLFFPLVIFISVIACTEKQIVGYGFLIFRKKVSKGNFKASYGIIIHDKHRRKKIGDRITQKLIKLAISERIIRQIYLTVFKVNYKAINLYNKHGFKTVRTLEQMKEYRGKQYKQIEMELDLA